MRYCSVKMCGKNTKTSGCTKDGISFHKFPDIQDIKKKWIEATQQKNWLPNKYSLICSRHFPTESFESLMKSKRRRLLDSAVPTLFLPIIECEVSRSTLDTIQPSQSQKYNTLQEYDHYNDEDTPDIKEEAEYSDEIKIGDGLPNRDKSYIAGQSRKIRAPIDATNDPDDYVEELNEFGKYVAEQLLCLEVEDARVARMKIVTVLTKFTSKRFRESGTPILVKKSKTIGTVPQAVPYKSRVQVATQRQFLTVNTAGPSIIPINISEGSVSQQGNIEPSVSKIARVKIEPIEDQSGMTDPYQVSSPGVSFDYIVVPATGPQFDNKIVQHGSTERPFVTSSGSYVGSVVTQSLNVVPARTSVTEIGSSNMNTSVVTVKTEPELESTHDSFFGEVQPSESLLVKQEPRSDDET